ncbi:MAG TPA: CDP-alcohol phosphatidyltransferase family protein [Candidatus Kapabacteria bacterium]|nr:CDP-alcohol phosphatidyltransferase family protein [Candidatus Kapabacteria bacterium]
MSAHPELHTSDRILTLSNSISFLRVLLAAPTVLFFLNGNYPATAALMAFAYITDIADGFIARKTNTISEFGKAIDPIADKIFVAAIVVAMVTKGMVPLWFVLLVIGKDIATLIGAIILRKKIDAIPPSNYWGKAAILATIIVLFLAVIGVSGDVLVFGWVISAALLIVSLAIYVRRAVLLVS